MGEIYSMNFRTSPRLSAFTLFFFAFILVQSSCAKSRLSPQGKTPVGVVEKGEILQRVTVAGIVRPERSLDVRSSYDGFVKKIYVKVGQHVKQGDPLVLVGQSMTRDETTYPMVAQFDGQVVQINKHEGEVVTQDSTKAPILRVDDLRKKFVVAKIPEVDRLRIKVGMEASLRATAILNRSYGGIIREIALAPINVEGWGNDSGKVEYEAQIEVTHPDESLYPGLTVIGDIALAKKQDTLILRHEFINRTKDGQIFVVLEKTKEKRAVTTGLQDDQASEILSGLKEGDRTLQIDFLGLLEQK